MDSETYDDFFKKSPVAFSYHQTIRDNSGFPVDNEFLGINKAFEALTGFNEHNTIGKSFKELFPMNTETLSKWSDIWSGTIINKEPAHMDIYYTSDKKWIDTVVFPLEEDIFACIYQDITQRRYSFYDKMLKEKTKQLQSILDNAPIGIWQTDDKSRPVFENKYATDNFLMIQENLEASLKTDKETMESNTPLSFEGTAIFKDNQSHILNIFKTRIHNEEDNTFGILGFAWDITDKKKANEALAESEKKYRLLTEHATDVIWVLNTTLKKLTYISPAVEKLRGYTPEEVLSHNPGESLTPESLVYFDDNVGQWLEEFIAAPNEGKAYMIKFQQPCKSGKVIWVEASLRFRYNSTGEIEIVGVSRDIEERVSAEERVLYLSNHDQLTGLFNRYYIESRMTEETERADRYNEPISMAILDLDHFKHINDTYGHPAGDEVLKRTAEAAAGVIRKSDIIGRLGGEEFIVLMPHTSLEGAVSVAEKIRVTLEKCIQPISEKVTASLGVAERLRSESYDRWYKRADDAMYNAKDKGRNRVAVNVDTDITPFITPLIEWKYEWNSGNDEIDRQHRKLLELGNSLINLSFSGAEPEKTGNQLETLIKHIISHFEYEEKVLINAGYPDYPEHIRIHNGLVSKAMNLRKNHRDGDIKSSAFISYILDDVIVGHMLEKDMLFFPYIKNTSA